MIHALIFALAMQRWLLVNDIHLDPFVNDTLSNAVHDTSPGLWEATLHAMHRDVPNPDIVVIGGDLMAHHWRDIADNASKNPTNAAIATTREIAAALGRLYPNAQFLVALGNNDDPCGDYRAETGGPYQRAIAQIWKPLIDRHGSAPDFAAQFTRGGYYTVTLPDRERAIVLNSVFWSFVNRPGCQSNTRGVAASQASWFATQLRELPQGMRAVVLMHIPPGYDSQTTVLARNLVAVPFLSPAANAAVLATFEQNREKIAFAIGAHTHHYDFRVVSGVPMIVGSSVSPVYGNYPAFFELTLDADGALHDVQPFVYIPADDQYERRPGFNALYDVKAPTAEAMTSINQRIRTNEATRDRWIEAHNAWAPVSLRNRAAWLPNACAQTELGGGFAECAGAVSWSRWLRLAVLVGGIAFCAVLWLLLRRRVDRAT